MDDYLKSRQGGFFFDYCYILAGVKSCILKIPISVYGALRKGCASF
jgi:hypothetical protein